MNAYRVLSAPRAERTGGFTILELMVVILLAGILLSMAVPAAVGWMSNLEHRKTARQLMYHLRDARSRTLALNREHRAEFEPERNRYRIVQGNRSLHSNEWSIIALDWTVFPDGVLMASNINTIHLNTNGTANAGSIRIMDQSQQTKYEVRVTRTGRIRMPAF